MFLHLADSICPGRDFPCPGSPSDPFFEVVVFNGFLRHFWRDFARDDDYAIVVGYDVVSRSDEDAIDLYPIIGRIGRSNTGAEV